ncbi:hypothetical protein [Streptomyces mirabilis]|uniref:hypothetical protein n=1 Tax=Streptomyces mirabilis TaxID=68239 RepID=UPI00224CFA5E|nr:hypothetical protein [Streptomyces mirabilis]MCX4615736.1 hypothetical protein [Streptomyces mirabilis]
MPWFVVDDNADSHPKFVAAGNAAIGLWARTGAYAARHLTDGMVPGDIAKMYGSKPQIAKLLTAGLWHEHGHSCTHPKCLQPAAGDFAIHDYLVYNPRRADVLAKRERAAEKKRKQRAAHDPHAIRDGFDDESHENRDGFDDDSSTNRTQGNDESAGHGDASPGDSGGTRARAFPSPPLPSYKGGADSESSAGSSGRGREALSLIPADWQPSDNDVQAAQLARSDAGREQLTRQQLDVVTRKFVRRMADDGVRAAGFGGRWQQWAENERTEQPSVGGNVVHLPGAMTKSQQQRAGLDRLRQQMNGGHSA